MWWHLESNGHTAILIDYQTQNHAVRIKMTTVQKARMPVF